MGHFDTLQATRFIGKLDLNENSSITGFVKLSATGSVRKEDSGVTHLVGAAATGLAADATFSLPAAENGLYYKFVYAGNAADAEDFALDTGSDANFFIGGLLLHDTTDGSLAPTFGDGNSNSIVTVLTPSAGTVVECYCDGTNWILWGSVVSASAPTFADQSA